MEWNEVLTVFAVIATNLGTVLALYIQSDKKIEENRKETNDILKGIREDMNQFHLAMRDFHGKLERQDAEFKSHLMHMHADKKRNE